MNASTMVRCIRNLLLLLTAVVTLDAQAQRLGTFNRITTPNGRAVLEIRQGKHPANPRLMFTAVITAGPVSGSTSLLLQQALVDDLFNQNAPAPGWTVVRSSLTAFSLGGGCGRSNLLDFPYINDNRPEILRITGTTQQVITLGIPGNNDQYDSIDCRTQSDGRVLYLLTNRTRQRLELRREQGGLLQLVRDDFGVVATPFRGGQRPAFNIFYRRPGPVAPSANGTQQSLGQGSLELGILFYESFVGDPGGNLETFGVFFFLDELLNPLGSPCPIAVRPDPVDFNGVKETLAVSTAVAGNVQGFNTLSLHRLEVPQRRLDAVNGGCTPQPTQNLGSAGPFNLYNFAGLAAVEGFARPGFLVPHNMIVAPSFTIVHFGTGQVVQSNPFVNRGGPVHGCGMFGSEIESGMMLAGPGSSNIQVQQSVFKASIPEILFGTGMEAELDGIGIFCDPQVPN